MIQQLTIFFTGITCVHCGNDPGRSNYYIWNGFYDMDTKQHVCHQCNQVHYQKKWLTEFKGLYSEFPVIIKP